MSLNAGPVQKQLKTVISSMAEKDLRRAFNSFSQSIGDCVDYNCKEISYKCYETSLSLKNKRASGYGRNDQQATCNAIRNLLQVLIEEEDMMLIIKLAIKKVNQAEEISKQNQPRKSLTIKSNLSAHMSIAQNTENKRSRPYLKTVNNFDNLNMSLLKSTTTKPTELELELEGAKIYISQLESKIKTLEEENKTLKTKTSEKNNPLERSVDNVISDYNLYRCSLGPSRPNTNLNHNLSYNQTSESSMLGTKKPNNDPSKQDVKKVPRLKLQILPSYHGKSTKSINSIILANQESFNQS